MKPDQNSPPSDGRKAILIVDDHPMTRYGLSRLIEQQPDLRIHGEASTAQQAVATLKPPLPSLILTDISMPGKGGMDFIKEIKAHHPGIPILVLSMHDESIFAERALRNGARGYIMKNEGGDKLLTAIRRVLAGDFYVSSNVSANILTCFTQARPERKRAQLGILTDREFEVFVLLSQGQPTGEISQRLSISGKTVETHRTHIKKKLKLKSSAEARKFAIRWGASQGLI
jgi:DNA-binding NarL/FixJ family response regulator